MLTQELLWTRVIPNLNHGFIMTVYLIVPSTILGFVGGVGVGCIRVFAPKPVRQLANGYVALFRGVPLLLQLYFIYFVLPQWGLFLSDYQSAVFGFALCSAAYHSEYIRGALLSIKQGQIKAAEALGFTTLQMVTYVIVPQAVRRALPGCGNEIIYLIKYSSLAHMITFIEITGEAKQLAMRFPYYIEIYSVAGLYYLALTTIAAWVLHKIEVHYAIPGFGNARA